MGTANFGVTLHNPVVAAGDTLRGDIWADVSTEINGSYLNVEFYGKEKTRVEYQRSHTINNADGTTRTEWHTEYDYGSRIIYSVQLPMNRHQLFANGGNTIAPGRYVLPFSFELPAFLPSTMDYSEYRSWGQIHYKIKAILKGSGFFYNYNCEQYVRVLSAAQPNRVQPFEGQPNSQEVRSCCCFSAGNITLAARLANTALAKGQTVPLSYSCRNNSTAGVTYVRAQLKQRVRLYAGGHSEYRSQVLYEVNFSKDSLSSKSKEETCRKRGVGSIQNELSSMVEEIRGHVHSQNVMIPDHPTLSTYHGSIINIEHELKLWVETDGCCMTNPEIRIPIQIFDVVRPSKVTEGPGFPVAMTQESALPTTYNPSAVANPPAYNPAMTVQPSAPPMPFNINDSGIVHAEAIAVQANDGIYGTTATSGSKEDHDEGEIVVPAMATATAVPSLTALLTEMKNASMGDVDVVKRRVGDPAWASVLAKLSPVDFATIVSTVQSAFDETETAETLAEAMGSSFTCAHVVKAVTKASDWNRANLVEKLIPHCSDFKTNYKSIQAVLTDWERTSTELAFRKEL